MQKLTSSPKTKLTLRNAVLFLYGGLGVLFILLTIAFLFYNLGTPEDSVAGGSIGSVKTGLWIEDGTWNLNREPISNEEIIISHDEEVTISRNIYLEGVTIKVSGTLKLQNSTLRLDEMSTILIAKTGKIVSEESADKLFIGSYPWMSDEINSIGSASQLTSSGESSMDLLPVELSYFKGIATNKNSIHLEWKTLSETNNSHFTLEKKVGESDFVLVDTVKGAGSSKHEILYTYEDKHLFAASIYYRLKQTDFDGNFKYFNIINVANDKSGRSAEHAVKIVQAGPNPFTDRFILLYNSYGNNGVSIKISTMNGKIVHQEMLKPIVGQNEYVLPENIRMESGAYIVSLIQNGRSEFVKMIKK